MMAPFAQSPIEASIWMAFVGLQEWIVDSILMTPVFKAAVLTWVGILIIKLVWQMTTHSAAAAVGRFGVSLCYVAIGLSLLRSKSPDAFQPTNAKGIAWSQSQKVKATGKYRALNGSVHGLSFYVITHRGAAAVGSLISERVGQLFKNQLSQQSPHLFLQTMAQTAGAAIDDPKVISELSWMFDNCADRGEAPVLAAGSSYSALFDLSREDCRNRYHELRVGLKHWAKDKWGSSLADATEIKISELKAKFGMMDEETLQNKMIASALVNMARQKNGQGSRIYNVANQALLSDSDTIFGSATSFFVGMDNALSVAGVANGTLTGVTGTDYLSADARNKAAAFYNRIAQFIPPIRGYAKGLLALAFVVGAVGLCFGNPRFMVAWFGMLVMFVAYEPLSSLLYETTMTFVNAKETVDALAALKNDPLALSGAAIIDDNLARIEAVYFTLQLGLAMVCGAGGISIFMFSKHLGHGLADNLVSKASALVNSVNIARAGRAAGR